MTIKYDDAWFRAVQSLLILILTCCLSSCMQQQASQQAVVQSYQAQSTSPRQVPAQATTPYQLLEGKVVAIVDGDTLTVLDGSNKQTRIRLVGIDAPESKQAFGTVSRKHLSDLVFNKQVTVEYDKTDGYGRTLGKVLVGGRDVNLEQIKAGLAWHYKYYENEQPPEDRQLYAEAELGARTAKQGLWVDPNPIPPWDFRRGRRGAAKESAEQLAEGSTPSTTSASQRSGTRSQTAASPQPQEETVYITRTGKKYHRAGCQYLRRSSIAVSLKEARQYHDACSVCRPPQ